MPSNESSVKPVRWKWLRSPYALVTFVSTLFIVSWYVAGSIFFLAATGQLPFFVSFWAPFMVALPVAAFVTRSRPRPGYIAYAVIGALGLVFFSDGGHGVEVYATSSNTAQFFDVITTIPLYLTLLIYGLFGARASWPRRDAAETRPAVTIPRSTFIAFITTGFIIGGLVVGLMAGTTESRLIAGAGSQADIVIVQGAGIQSNGQFYSPAGFTAKIGGTVTWANRDNTVHTVTSNTGVFDSKDIAAGAVYKFTFNTLGNYSYYCTYHSWMKGSIKVTS